MSAGALFPGFTSGIANANGIQIPYVMAGSGPPLLLLHGHPQTHVIWHKVAPALAQDFTVIASDLRGYGAASKPAGLADHSNYSKREMARDQVALMQGLGCERFSLVGHDRGGRVGHRLALDHPQSVDKMMLLDISPTLAMYQQTTMEFARAYWHWFFLIQPAPLPDLIAQLAPSAPQFTPPVALRPATIASPSAPCHWERSGTSSMPSGRTCGCSALACSTATRASRS